LLETPTPAPRLCTRPDESLVPKPQPQENIRRGVVTASCRHSTPGAATPYVLADNLDAKPTQENIRREGRDPELLETLNARRPDSVPRRLTTSP